MVLQIVFFGSVATDSKKNVQIHIVVYAFFFQSPSGIPYAYPVRVISPVAVNLPPAVSFFLD